MSEYSSIESIHSRQWSIPPSPRPDQLSEAMADAQHSRQMLHALKEENKQLRRLTRLSSSTDGSQRSVSNDGFAESSRRSSRGGVIDHRRRSLASLSHHSRMEIDNNEEIARLKQELSDLKSTVINGMGPNTRTGTGSREPYNQVMNEVGQTLIREAGFLQNGAANIEQRQMRTSHSPNMIELDPNDPCYVTKLKGLLASAERGEGDKSTSLEERVYRDLDNLWKEIRSIKEQNIEILDIAEKAFCKAQHVENLNSFSEYNSQPQGYSSQLCPSNPYQATATNVNCVPTCKPSGLRYSGARVKWPIEKRSIRKGPYL